MKVIGQTNTGVLCELAMSEMVELCGVHGVASVPAGDEISMDRFLGIKEAVGDLQGQCAGLLNQMKMVVHLAEALNPPWHRDLSALHRSFIEIMHEHETSGTESHEALQQLRVLFRAECDRFRAQGRTVADVLGKLRGERPKRRSTML